MMLGFFCPPTVRRNIFFMFIADAKQLPLCGAEPPYRATSSLLIRRRVGAGTRKPAGRLISGSVYLGFCTINPYKNHFFLHFFFLTPMF